MKIVKTKTYDSQDFFTLISSVCGYGEYSSQNWVWDPDESETEEVEKENEEGETETEEKQVTKVLVREEELSKYDHSFQFTFETAEGEVRCGFMHSEIEEILREKGIIESKYDLKRIYKTCDNGKWNIDISKSTKVKSLFRDVEKARASYRRIAAVAAVLIVMLCPILIAFI